MGDIGIKIAALLLAFSLTVASIFFAAFLMYHLNRKSPIPDPKSTETATVKERSNYFSATSQITAMLNILCCLTVTMYCILIIIDSQHDLVWFIALRATVGVCWFFSKVSLIWLYNGRLYYAFSGSALQSSYVLFITLNAVIAIAAPLCLIFGFVGVWNGIMWLISVGFEGFRLIYLVFTIILLFMFTRRLLSLQHIALQNTDAASVSKNIENILLFIHVASKNAVLVLFISIGALLVVIAWTIHDYATAMDEIALLLPLEMFALDSVLTSFCIFLLFNFGKTVYQKLCHVCDGCCRNLCMGRSNLNELELQVKSHLEESPKPYAGAGNTNTNTATGSTVTMSIH